MNDICEEVVKCLDRHDSSAHFYLLVLHIFVDIVMILIVIGLNVFIILSISRYWKASVSTLVSTTSCRLVLSLATADILVGLSSAYYLTFHYSCVVEDALEGWRVPCFFKFAMTLYSHSASWYSLLAIAVDKYLAVVHALRYRALMNTRRVTGIIALVWMVSGMNVAIYLFTSPWTPEVRCSEENMFSGSTLIAMTVVSCLLITSILVFIYWRIHVEAVAVTQSVPGRTRSSALLLFLGAGCFILTFLPLIVVVCAKVLLHCKYLPQMEIANSITFTISKINFIVNPFLYSWKNKAIRTAMKSQFRHCFKFKQNRVRSTDSVIVRNRRTRDSSITSVSMTFQSISEAYS